MKMLISAMTREDKIRIMNIRYKALIVDNM